MINNYKNNLKKGTKKISDSLQTTDHWQTLQSTEWSTYCGDTDKYES